MKNSLWVGLLVSIFPLAFLGGCGGGGSGSSDSLVDVVEQAYVYGYPLVIMDVSKWVMTTSDPSSVNRFNHARSFPDASFTDVVSPNIDTLYSQAWLDLSVTPMVLSVPDIDPKRYYLMQFLDAWSNVFASVGTRTTGNGKGEFLITGPGWTGKTPDGMTRIESPTHLVWLLGRTQTNGKADYDAVHAIQEGYLLRPLIADATPAGPDSERDHSTAPVVQMDEMDDPNVFFSRLSSLMGDNPPAPADAPLIARMARIGVHPGETFNPDALSPAVRAAIDEGYAKAKSRLIENSRGTLGVKRGAWSIMPDNIGNYGTDYDFRAIIARVALGANLKEDAVYPAARTDESGQTLTGSRSYEVRFEKGQLPPVRAFWSITMYNNDQFFVVNPINRYAIGDRDALQFNADGSLTIYIQHESPGPDKEANWLPAPADDFNLIMRLYWPDETILDGTWPMPSLKAVSE